MTPVCGDKEWSEEYIYVLIILEWDKKKRYISR